MRVGLCALPVPVPDLVPTALFGLTLLTFVGVGEALRAWAGWAPEASRRFVHTATGIAVALCPPFFSAPTGIYMLAVLFVGVNIVAVRRRLFLGMHGIARETWGTVAFPLALIAALYLCWTLDPGRVYILRAAFLVLAVSDPLAAWLGSKASGGCYAVGGQSKTLAGSVAFVVSAAILVAAALALWAPEAFGWREIGIGAASAASLAGAAEALGVRGWDNLWIVLAVIVGLTVVHASPEASGVSLSAVAVAVSFGLVSVRLGFLDVSGALAAGLLAWAVVALGGVAWAVPGFVFFFASSLLSRLGRQRKEAAAAKAEKGSQRDASQVAANGGVAGLLLAATLFAPEAYGVLYWGFVGAFAAAAADTWSTEIGTWAQGATREVLRWRRVAPGESGGVSVAGTLGGVAGAALVVASAWAFAPEAEWWAVEASGAVLALGSGVLAAWVDSALGATFQARFRRADGSLTEAPTHDGVALPLARGWAWVTNDRVNLVCTLVGGLVPLAVLSVWG